MNRRALAVATVGLVLVAGSCTAEEGNDERDEAQAAAKRVATALSEREWKDLGDQEVRSELDRIFERIGSVDAEVTAGTVEVDGSRASVPLTWDWAVPGKAWRYATTARLQRDDAEWTLAWQPDLVEPSLQEGEALEATTITADRGDILGTAGTEIVTERPVIRFGLDKSLIGEKQAIANATPLAQLLEIAPGPYRKAVRSAGKDAFVEGVVLRRDEGERLNGPRLAAIRGAVALNDSLPLGPTRTFAAPLLGRVGLATKEILDKSKGAVRAGDEVGLSGLQARYDDQLRGRPGTSIEATVPQGPDRELFRVAPASGKPLRTTLDVNLQTQAESVLSDVDPASAVVAIKPSSGQIVAAASGPGGDGYNTATFGQYAPGSTFKVVTALALLRSGLTPESMVECPSTTTVDGKTFKNYDDYPSGRLGKVTLRTAFANSCNTAMITSGADLGDQDLAEAAEALGLGVDRDLGFPAYFGQVPAPASETEMAADLIGQGKVLSSPMIMATVAASVVSGERGTPRLLTAQQVDADPPAVPLTQAEARDLRTLMRAVVTEGSGAFLNDLPGAPVGAKTGTAEYGEADASGQLPTHTWMIATQGDLAVAVFVETGQSGSTTAGPILEEFLRGVR